MRIRIAQPTDAPLISAIVTSLAYEHIATTLEPGGIETLLSSMDVASTSERLCADYEFFMAEKDGIIVGIAAIKLPSHLYYLFVDTEYQRQGIGRRLFAHVRDRIFELSDSTTISVNSSLNAVEAYQRFGFVVSGAIQNVDGVRYQPMQWADDH